jgi:Spy/CpxP family protein refolding chaperone
VRIVRTIHRSLPAAHGRVTRAPHDASTLLWQPKESAMKTLSMSRSFKLMAAGLALALGGAFAVVTAQAAPGHHGGGYHGMMGGRMIERMLDGVNATDAQRAQIRQIVQSAMTDLKAQRQAARSLREQSMQLFTQPTVDANAAEALRQQMLQQHDQASRRMLQAMLDASNVLTPEQRVQLGERMKQRREMFERHRRERESLQSPRS